MGLHTGFSAEELLKTRKERRMSIAAVARALGTNEGCISKWERGVSVPHPNNQTRILAWIRNAPVVDETPRPEFSAEELRKARKAKRMTGREAGLELGVGQGTVSMWERGRSVPSLENQIRIMEWIRNAPVVEEEEEPEDLFFSRKRLQKIRRLLGATLQDLAQELGVSRQTVWNWESGGARPSYEHQASLLKWMEEKAPVGAGTKGKDTQMDSIDRVDLHKLLGVFRSMLRAAGAALYEAGVGGEYGRGSDHTLLAWSDAMDAAARACEYKPESENNGEVR